MAAIDTSSPRLGATVLSGSINFRVWAPHCKTVEVQFDGGELPTVAMEPLEDGYFQVMCSEAHAGDLYRYRLDGDAAYPDPYSKFQPQGPHGPSRVVDPDSYRWQDAAWQGLDPALQIIYELHIGTFTENATYAAAARDLERLRDLGITCIELMPVNEFVGRFGWGYDGVNWFAPFHRYGDSDDLKSFIDSAHELGLGVILDVVYNHFGHDGNYLPRFSADYFTDKISNPWGSTPNYACPAMRRLAIDNAAYWVREFHFDGLRLDAIQNIYDPEEPTLLAELVREARRAAGTRSILISAEDYLQRTSLLADEKSGGAGIDLLWNDDFHHACRVAMTGNHYGFFKNYRGTSQEILSSLKRGFLFQGQFDDWSKTHRGVPLRNEPLNSFVAFTQNHDAVANTLDGQRLAPIVSPGKYRALTAALLLGPQTPLIFMGQEFGAATPFAYFADYPCDSGTLLSGRKIEARQSLQYQDPGALARILDPTSIDTVLACTLRDEERRKTLRLFTDLIRLRRRFEARLTANQVDGAQLSGQAFAFRWFSAAGADRLLLINLGEQLELRAWAEPLLAVPGPQGWRQLWCSESSEYGGMGAIEVCVEHGWQLSAESASLLIANPEN